MDFERKEFEYNYISLDSSEKTTVRQEYDFITFMLDKIFNEITLEDVKENMQLLNYLGKFDYLEELIPMLNMDESYADNLERGDKILALLKVKSLEAIEEEFKVYLNKGNFLDLTLSEINKLLKAFTSIFYGMDVYDAYVYDSFLNEENFIAKEEDLLYMLLKHNEPEISFNNWYTIYENVSPDFFIRLRDLILDKLRENEEEEIDLDKVKQLGDMVVKLVNGLNNIGIKTLPDILKYSIVNESFLYSVTLYRHSIRADIKELLSTLSREDDKDFFKDKLIENFPVFLFLHFIEFVIQGLVNDSYYDYKEETIKDLSIFNDQLNKEFSKALILNIKYLDKLFSESMFKQFITDRVHDFFITLERRENEQ